MEPKIIPVTSLRPQLLKYVSKSQKLGQEYIITKNGKPSAVVMGYDEWQQWKETMDVLTDPHLLKRISKGRSYFKRGGKGKTLSEVFSDS